MRQKHLVRHRSRRCVPHISRNAMLRVVHQRIAPHISGLTPMVNEPCRATANHAEGQRVAPTSSEHRDAGDDPDPAP
jgi:hypothetical protein